MYYDFLSHEGKPTRSGRYKWGSGDRPFQRLEKAKKYFQPTIKVGKDKSNISPLEKISRDTRNVTDTASRITTKAKSNKKLEKYRKEASSMTDEELRNVINRLDMEKRYSELSAQTSKSGAEYVDKILSTMGDVAFIVGTVAGIGSTIYELNKKG